MSVGTRGELEGSCAVLSPAQLGQSERAAMRCLMAVGSSHWGRLLENTNESGPFLPAAPQTQAQTL